MLNQPRADPQIILEQLQLSPDLKGRAPAFANFLFDCLKATRRLIEPGQCLGDVLRRRADQSKAQHLHPIPSFFNFRTHQLLNASSMTFEAVAPASTVYDPVAYDRASDSSLAWRSGESAASDLKLFTNSDK
jgi:hypothetical protein